MKKKPQPENTVECTTIVVIVSPKSRLPCLGRKKQIHTFKHAERHGTITIGRPARAAAGNMHFFPAVFALPSPSNGTRQHP